MLPSSWLCANSTHFYLPDLAQAPQHRKESPLMDHVKRTTTSRNKPKLHFCLVFTTRANNNLPCHLCRKKQTGSFVSYCMSWVCVCGMEIKINIAIAHDLSQVQNYISSTNCGFSHQNKYDFN
jgi:hypothetical protein